MDLTESLAAKSDQLNAVDLPEPRTFTIEKITAGSREQPFNFHLVEAPDRPWRPSKGMRRVLARGWGAKQIETRYPGRRLTLYCNPEVRYAGVPVGGIQVSHMSDIGEPFTMPLRISQKQTVQYTVELLTDTATQPTAPTPDEIVRMTDLDELKALWRSHPDLRGFIESRVAEIKPQPAPEAAAEPAS